MAWQGKKWVPAQDELQGHGRKRSSKRQDPSQDRRWGGEYEVQQAWTEEHGRKHDAHPDMLPEMASSYSAASSLSQVLTKADGSQKGLTKLDHLQPAPLHLPKNEHAWAILKKEEIPLAEIYEKEKRSTPFTRERARALQQEYHAQDL